MAPGCSVTDYRGARHGGETPFQQVAPLGRVLITVTNVLCCCGENSRILCCLSFFKPVVSSPLRPLTGIPP